MPAGGRRAVDDDERVAAGGPVQRHDHAGRRLVVRVRVDVALDRVEAWPATAPGSDLERPRVRRGAARAWRPRRTSTRTRRARGASCAARSRPNAAASQNERRAAVAEQHLVAVGQREQLGEPVADARARPTARRRAGGSCRGSRGAASASAATASSRTFDGPEPKRPSVGRRSGGSTMSVALTASR